MSNKYLAWIIQKLKELIVFIIQKIKETPPQITSVLIALFFLIANPVIIFTSSHKIAILTNEIPNGNVDHDFRLAEATALLYVFTILFSIVFSVTVYKTVLGNAIGRIYSDEEWLDL
jgi:hypothetical protein